MARFSINLRNLVILVADPSSYMSMLIHSMLRGFGSNKVLEARSSSANPHQSKDRHLDLRLAASAPRRPATDARHSPQAGQCEPHNSDSGHDQRRPRNKRK